MFDPDSRYAGLPTTTATTSAGTTVVVVTRRFLPMPPSTVANEIEVGQDDRLDLIASRVFGDANRWWQIADAHATLEPQALEAQPGARLRIPTPKF